jgi:asparagine synthase (glutamine-hydrolysing)
VCGIAGIVHFSRQPVDARLLEAMTRSLAHRGPDGEGYVLLTHNRGGKPISVMGRLSDSVRTTPSEYAIGFGHRRLAILDRSHLGNQPMGCEQGEIWITYNGEVYNYLELREELQQLGWCFQSMTDTEVILRAYQQWGTECLSRFNGMFAFAIWDGLRNRLFCARDRLGIKPFYFRETSDGIIFGSEIKALLQDPGQVRSPNKTAVHAFLVLGLQDHSEETFFAGIHQLRPGHALVMDDGQLKGHRWWDLPSLMHGEVEEGLAAQSLRGLFEDAVRLHLRSDVPVGSCLSGGLDSSSIVCAMRRVLPDQQIKTFSSCFDDAKYDERPYSQAVARERHLDSTEVFPDARRLFDELPRVLWFQDEPFSGASYLAQWAVMRAASEQGLKVLLDGQGGDELLCGYPGYWGSYIGDLFRSGSIAKGLHTLHACYRRQSKLDPMVVSNIARVLLPGRLVAQCRSWIKGDAHWIDQDFLSRYPVDTAYENRYPTAIQNHVAAYLQTHSLPALLHHEDRNSMAFSIEARLPFLDTRLVDCLWKWPARLKLRDGVNKYVMREAMKGLIPEKVRTRGDKMGFATPQDRWLGETLRPELESLFSSSTFAQREYWDSCRLQKAYKRYCAGELEIGTSIWRCVTLELWHQQFCI